MTMKFVSAATAIALLAAVEGCSAYGKPCNDKKHFTCPKGGTLPKQYVSPSLVVPVSKSHPDQSFGSQDIGLITPNDFCTVVTLDLPASASKKICQLTVLFPNHDQTNNYYVYAGDGKFEFTGYDIGVKVYENVTYNSQPGPGPSPPSPPFIGPGNAYTIFRAPCSTPAQVTTVGGVLCANATTWNFQQSDKKCPLGFFVELFDQ